jgi:hypothetical protein
MEGSGRSFNPQAWGLFALILIFGGILIAMGAKIWDVKWLLFAGLVLAFGGMFGIAALGLLGQTSGRTSKARRKSAPPAAQKELVRADTTNKLLPIGEDDFIPSVVDDTTELLHTPAAREIRD